MSGRPLLPGAERRHRPVAAQGRRDARPCATRSIEASPRRGALRHDDAHRARARSGATASRAPAALVLACLALVAVFADLLASDLPARVPLARDDLRAARRDAPGGAGGARLHAACERERGAGRLDRRCRSSRTARASRRARRRSSLPPLSTGHPLGTDALGRDVFARVVHGARTALGAGPRRHRSSSSLIGVAARRARGVRRGRRRLARVARGRGAHGHPDAGPRRSWSARLVPHPTTATLLLDHRAHALDGARAPGARRGPARRSATDYVTAARALGASPPRILARHVLPNAIGPAIVAAAFGVASVVLHRGGGRLPARRVAGHDGVVGRGDGRGARTTRARGGSSSSRAWRCWRRWWRSTSSERPRATRSIPGCAAS